MPHRFNLYFQKLESSDRIKEHRAWICLNSYLEDREGRIFLTPDCVCIQEFEARIDILKNELEYIRKQGRRRFSKAERELRDTQAQAIEES